MLTSLKSRGCALKNDLRTDNQTQSLFFIRQLQKVETPNIPVCAPTAVPTHRIVTHSHGWASLILGRLPNLQHAIKDYHEVLGLKMRLDESSMLYHLPTTLNTVAIPKVVLLVKTNDYAVSL